VSPDLLKTAAQAMAAPVLLSCEGISKSFGAQPLFQGLTFALSEGDHVGLIGPNGSGKSTLLRILAGLDEPDSGTRSVRRGLRIGYVPQDPVFAPGRTVEQVVLAAFPEALSLDDHEKSARAAAALRKSGFQDIVQRSELLSGGWRKRLAIARELAQEPDVLLLDEPTNHLDVEGILWLESLLRSEPEAFIVVSHDRYFLENVARRMLELSRSYPEGLLQTEGSYTDFLEKREEVLKNETAYQETLANMVRREIEWLRRGPKARTTKSKSRIQAAGRLIGELEESRSRSAVSTAGIDFTSSDRATKRLWSGEGLSKRFGAKTIVQHLDLLLTRGSRLGVLGPNGSGKSTLLRMIVGEVAPDSGKIERAEGLRVVYFEQNRETLDQSQTLKRALAPEGDSVVFRDRSLHVASWAKRFLFRPEQLETSVSRLSGGEKARIVLARLMLKPADLLVLDEPTNDLDIPTLDVLEESLLDFPGALVLVTHDRSMLDRVSTRILALDGEGGADFYADFPQWEAARSQPPAAKTGPAAAPRERNRARKLSYKEQNEWDQMEAKVLDVEERLAEARRLAEDPAIAADAAALQKRFTEMAALQEESDRLYQRWAELEEKLN
jgi:ABC transport system ATP-binding/permease protein